MIVPPSSIDQVLLGGDYFSSSEKTRKIQISISNQNLCIMYKSSIWCAENFRIKSTGIFEVEFGTVQKSAENFGRDLLVYKIFCTTQNAKMQEIAMKLANSGIFS